MLHIISVAASKVRGDHQPGGGEIPFQRLVCDSRPRKSNHPKRWRRQSKSQKFHAANGLYFLEEEHQGLTLVFSRHMCPPRPGASRHHVSEDIGVLEASVDWAAGAARGSMTQASHKLEGASEWWVGGLCYSCRPALWFLTLEVFHDSVQ